MRALIVDKAEVRLDSNRQTPKPGVGEALIRLTRAMISRGTFTSIRGASSASYVPGHCFVGEVESIGGGTNANLVGKRIVASCINVCGKCDMCVGGLSSHCRARTIKGMIGRDGCLSERFLLPSKNLVPVPDSVDDDNAAFTNLVASAVQAAQQLTIVGKPYITVLGDGPLGLVMVQVMSRLNASVRLIGHHPDKLAICEKWGVKHRPAGEVGRRADQDVVVDCTGLPSGLTLALQLVRPRGKIVMKSLHAVGEPDGSDSDNMAAIVMNEIELIGSHFGPVGDALAMIARREVDVVSLITRRMSLSDGHALFKAAAQGGSLAVLVEP
jgi:threonine dehydrogenase-like Zn-dependent dehydrogenase